MDFDLTIAWFAVHLLRSVVAEYFRVDWETVGRCVSRTKEVIDPEISHRLDNLVNIGIDETSYKKGHKFITVIVNHDTNTVVWVVLGHGKSVLEKFYQQLTEEQRASIKVVTGDGAKWITECVNEFTPDCARCVDQFHVVQWAMEALDEVRRESWRDAYAQVKELKKLTLAIPADRKKMIPATQEIRQASEKADKIKTHLMRSVKPPNI